MPTAIPSVLVSICACLSAAPVLAQSSLWTQQTGGPALDIARGVVSDGAGGNWTCGYTLGSLAGTNVGGVDAFALRFDAERNVVATCQFGSSAGDFTMAAAPSADGGCFLAGFTLGALAAPNAGGNDAWLARVSPTGATTWKRQLGSPASDQALAACEDGSGGAFVGGSTAGVLGTSPSGGEDAWVARYDAAGVRLWTWQAGGSGSDVVRGLAPSVAGGVFVVGSTASGAFGPQLGGGDAWLAHLDGNGTLLWSRQLGGSEPESFEAVAASSDGRVLAAGLTMGSLAGPHAGARDAWIVEFDSNGAPLGSVQFGTSADDVATALRFDLFSGWIVGGKTKGALAAPASGGWDAWIAAYDSVGDREWLEQHGTGGDDEVTSIASDGAGGGFVAGLSGGALFSANAGSFDAWCGRWGANCECGLSFCPGGTSSNSCTPSLTALGRASAGAGSAFVLSVSQLDGQRAGLIFFGFDNTGFQPTPWAPGSSSSLCVRPPTVRTPVQDSGGTSGACDGEFALDFGSFAGSFRAPFSAGADVFAQAWFRDPPAPRSTNLTNAIHFRLCP